MNAPLLVTVLHVAVLHAAVAVPGPFAAGPAASARAAAAPAAPERRDRAPDELVRDRGRPVEGWYLATVDDVVLFRVGTKVKEYEVDEVVEIRSPVLHYPELAARLAATPAYDSEANSELAAWCTEQGMPVEAELLHWRAALANWERPEPHEALGHRERRGGWEVEHDRSWHDLEELREETRDFGDAFVVRTSLHEVTSNATLEEGVEAAAWLIRVYALFHDQFAAGVPLRHATEVMELHLHGDSASFPETSSTLPGYFVAEDNRIVMDAQLWEGLPDLAHQCGHQLLYAAYQDYRRGVGAQPGWLGEAVALGLEQAFLVEDGPDPSLEAQRGNDLFAVHARSEDPDSLNRVLNYDVSGLHRPLDNPLQPAQSYTLWYFLSHADEHAFRDGLRAYFAGTFDGKASPTDFKNAFEIDDDELEERWRAWVREVASVG